MTTKVKNGLIGFFDILGYSSFLENNEAVIAVDIITDLLREIQTLKENAIKTFSIENTVYSEIVKRIEYLIISDSIILSLVCKKREDEDNEYKDELKVFLLYSSFLMKKLFIKGLPLRGSIDYGEFVIVENTFVGKPIINSYKAGNKINLAACSILEPVGIDILKDLENDLYFKYNTPIRNGEEISTLLHFLIGEGEGDNYKLDKIKDFKQFIMDSFVKHNKPLDKKVYQKIINTEMFLRFCKAITK
ncbi:MAG: hypothetical protein JXR69_04765 [Candidatus Delongbacteria bacterium]|nr:hypothetical protein [Candidatus Delongbacteria bacterium]